MIHSITIANNRDESIELVLTKPELSGFLVKSIDGLGPSKANVSMTDVATMDGSLYNSSRLEKRNIIIHLEFLQTQKESIEDIRHKSYRYFPLKKNIRVKITTDTRVVETDGYVESNEPTIFSNREGCSVSILCPDPMLYSTHESVTVFSGVRPTFEFPLENIGVEPTLELGTIEHKTEQTVFYEGDSDTGLTISIHATDIASNITIYNLTTREQMKIDTSKLAAITNDGVSTFIAGDTITIESRSRNKRVTLLRNGNKINILNCLDRGVKWFTLSKGDNIFAYRAETGSANLQFRITNRIAYEGV